MTNRWARARERARDYVNQIKLERGCEMCGYNEKASNLQWHHVIPEIVSEVDISEIPIEKEEVPF